MRLLVILPAFPFDSLWPVLYPIRFDVLIGSTLVIEYFLRNVGGFWYFALLMFFDYTWSRLYSNKHHIIELIHTLIPLWLSYFLSQT